MPAEVESMFSAREVPWHRVGTITEDALTAREAIVAGGLDWTVEKRPIYIRVGAEFHKVEDRFATVRNSDDKYLGTVAETYVPFQNVDAFTFADNLVDSGEAKYETAGSLRGGRWVWLTMKLPKEIRIGGEDAHELYLLVNSSHDGSKAITASVTPIRVVCMNTLNLALREAQQRWSVRHVSTAGQRLQEAREALKLTFDYADQFEAVGNELIARPFTENEMSQMLEKLIPNTPKAEGVRATIQALFVESPTLENVRGTQWAALNAVGEYFDWVRGPRTAESQLMGSLYGVGPKFRNKTLDMLGVSG